MPEENPEFDVEKYSAHMAEGMRWARLFVTIEEITEDNKQLVRDLSAYDPTVAVPLLASLLTLPDYQSQCIRLEILVALAVGHCRGRKKANINEVRRWFSQIGKSRCVDGEDPAEDVFVSLVHDDHGDYRLLGGVWEGAGFYTQRILDIVATMPDEAPFDQIKKTAHALLTISDIVCEKAGLQRYQLGSDEQHSELSPNKLPGRSTLISRVTVTFAELDERGIEYSDIEPFLFHPKMKKDLIGQYIARSYLDQFPFIKQDDSRLTVALPTALSVAMRDYVIHNIIKCGLVEKFDDILAKNYQKLFYDTPLLGGPSRAPVPWQKFGEHRIANFNSEVDKGYYISYYLFLPSVQKHTNGGFKTAYRLEDALTETLQKSIDDVFQCFEGKDDFKGGQVVLVDCGWGKVCNPIQITEIQPQWRFLQISVDDLVRLSWSEGMNPLYFWRIQDGLEAIEKAGVEILNPSGILNLIGWVRYNNGHFVPHAQLPDGDISPNQPLVLNPPTNLIREVRAQADQGYDRHRSIDNTGTWRDVQRISQNPFFSSDSERRLFVSINDLDRRILTTVYEGKHRLWHSVTAANLSQREIEYRLWEMANEWLHRIGTVLDARFETATETHNLKVYIEFHDTDPPKEIQKPRPQDLVPLCKISDHNEKHAYKVVFETGFLNGFNIAENVAERLFVRNVVRAFLQLLGMKNINREVQKIEDEVVQNNEARHFHLFRTQKFIDYVQDTLPEELIAIDPIDEATVRLGLGWRVNEREQGNKIEGREACNDFLGKVVEVLLDEVIDVLATSDRLSTIKRLVANSEKASAEAAHWKRTSAAILGLHRDNPKTIERAVEQTSRFTGAGVASRILSEIALCACPSKGGGELSNIEMSKLIARASLIVHIGGLSDAIYYNALAPEIIISSLGDILFRNEFGRLVVRPMLFRMAGDKFVADAPLQKRNYEAPEVVTDAPGKISAEFLDIWKIEMGFDLDEASNIIDALEQKGRAEKTVIFEISQSEYFRLVCSDLVSEGAAARFLSQFTLTTRLKWKKPPKGFAAKDIYPWRLGRRLSSMARPILKIEDSDDPLLLIAPAALRKGFIYIFSGAYSGRLEQSFFRTKQMKDTWWGKASEGHSFNAEVAQSLLDAEWQVRSNIGLPEILNQSLERDYGDVDVLAWRLDRNQVLVIECKDLSPALNYSKIAELLSDYQGVEVDGKADKLKKHLDRISLLKENQEKLQRFVDIQQPEIVSCLVCSGVVPMQYASIDELADTHVGSVEDILTL